MSHYLVQIEADKDAPVDAEKFVKVQADDHRQAALGFVATMPFGRYSVLVARDKPENKHPNGMPIRVFALDIIRGAEKGGSR